MDKSDVAMLPCCLSNKATSQHGNTATKITHSKTNFYFFDVKLKQLPVFD